MAKFKYNIIKKSLSWENRNQRYICDYINCKDEGKYKAPKSRIRLNDYFFFCLKHVKEYNSSWDFYKGLNVDQIELSMRKDAIWDRPSWPFKGNPNSVVDQITQFLKNDYKLFENERDFRDFLKSKIVDDKLTNQEHKSLKIFNLSVPISVDEIKKNIRNQIRFFIQMLIITIKKQKKNLKKLMKLTKFCLKNS